MKLTNKQIQEILDGTPEGATHVNCYEGDCVYLCMNGWMWLQYTGKDWFDVNEEPLMHYIGFNNLSDLREILELRQEVERLKASIESAVGNMEYAAFNLLGETELRPKYGERIIESTCPEKSLLIAIRDLKEAREQDHE